MEQIEEEVDLQGVMENIDNKERQLKLQLKGLKEGLEGDNMVGGLVDRLCGFKQTGFDKDRAAYKLKNRLRSTQDPRNILIKFQSETEVYGIERMESIERLVLSIFTAISPIMLRKRQELKCFYF